MKIQFWSIGKNHEPYVKQGVEDFTHRISKYFPVEWNIIPVPKNAGMLSEMDLKKKEGETILAWLKKDDYMIALDEHGKEMGSSGRTHRFSCSASHEGPRRGMHHLSGYRRHHRFRKGDFPAPVVPTPRSAYVLHATEMGFVRRLRHRRCFG